MPAAAKRPVSPVNFPTIAKIIVVVSVLLVFGLVWAGWAMLRQLARPKTARAPQL